MSMLAEPRRKKAWVLNPRKSEWADDESKFGQKMLEQMGWSKGKGLGKEMAGITEHIRPSVQNDSRGLGYEGRSDDWVAHLDDFNDLLASLQQGKKEATGGEGPTKSSVKSLEERSKKSRARVHYHKFTRGKDLSRYSSQDLASILGGRSEGAVASQPVTPVSSRPPSPPPHADSEPVSEAETEQPQPPATEVDKSSGYTTISTGLSVKDYFAAKMRKMKMLKIKREQEQKDGSSGEAKSCGEAATEDVAEANASETVEQEAVKSKKKKKKRAASPAEQTCVAEEGGDASEQPKKKRKKSAANVGEVIPRVPEVESAVSDESKEAASPAEQALPSVPEEEKASTSEKSKKKKKKSASNVEEVVPPVPEEQIVVSEEPPKKKKKRKNAASSPEETSEAAADQSPQPDVSPEADSAPAVEPNEEAPADETEKAASKKKKKRKKSKSKRNDDSD